MRHALLAGAAALAAIVTLPASAGTLTAADLAADNALLSSFNAIVSGNYLANNESEGRIIVGGNLTSSNGNNVCFNGCAGNTTINGVTYGAVTVFGNASGNTINAGHGDIAIGGSNSSTLELNHNGGVNLVGSNSAQISDASFVRTSMPTLGGSTQNVQSNTITTGVPAGTVFPYGTFAQTAGNALTNLANALPTIASGVTTQTIPANSNNFSSTAVSTGSFGTKHYGFYTTTVSALSSAQNFAGIDPNGLDAVFVIVSGSGSVSVPQIAANGHDDGRIIWDFTGNDTITINGLFDGNILAPTSTITNAADIEGSVVAQTLNVNNELHKNYLFDGDLSGLPTSTATVPEPTGMLAVGAGLLGLLRLRRRQG
jgi:hypothetical protein